MSCYPNIFMSPGKWVLEVNEYKQIVLRKFDSEPGDFVMGDMYEIFRDPFWKAGYKTNRKEKHLMHMTAPLYIEKLDQVIELLNNKKSSRSRTMRLLYNYGHAEHELHDLIIWDSEENRYRQRRDNE